MRLLAFPAIFRQRVREGGLRNAAGTTIRYLQSNICRYSLETYYVFECDLDKPIELSKPVIPVQTVRIGNSEVDIDALTAVWPEYYRYGRNDKRLRADIRKYMNSGDECFCITYDERIVGMLWVGYQGNHMVQAVASKIGLRDEEAIFHRAYISAEVRGFQLYEHLLRVASKYIRDKGYKKWYGYVGVMNTGTLRGISKVCDRVRVIHHLEIEILGRKFHLFPQFHEHAVDLDKRKE